MYGASHARCTCVCVRKDNNIALPPKKEIVGLACMVRIAAAHGAYSMYSAAACIAAGMQRSKQASIARGDGYVASER